MDDSRRARSRLALVLAGASALVAAYAAYRERAVAGWIAGATSAALALAALLAPDALRPFHRAWMALSFAMGWVTSRLLLTAIFALLVTPVAIVARLVGKRFLELKADPKRPSYWEKRDPARTIDHRKMSLAPAHHSAMRKLRIVLEYLGFLLTSRNWWLLPIALSMLILGLVLVFAQGSPVAPFIYTLF